MELIDELLEAYLLLFGCTRDAILTADDRMRFIMMPGSRPSEEYSDYYYLNWNDVRKTDFDDGSSWVGPE